METLTIHAVTPASARVMLAALSGFDGEVVETADGRCLVAVALNGDGSEIVDVLNALERCVTERDSGPAQFELGARTYIVHPRAAVDGDLP